MTLKNGAVFPSGSMKKTNRVIRGLKGEGWNQKAIYPYERQGGGWTNCSGLYTLPQLLKKNIMWA